MDPAVPGAFGAIEDGSIAIQDGRIVRVGRRVELAGNRARSLESLGGAWVTPGLVDCHTHLLFAGNRAGEFEERLKGATYEQIAAAGGGIASTVAAVRDASTSELVRQSRPRLEMLMRGGVTTVEIKSGYGLDWVNERKMLEAAGLLGEGAAVRIARTFLALHAVPPERREDRAAFIREVVDDMLPIVAAEGLAISVDAFCEGIGFTRDETRSLFDAARKHGLGIKLHAEQLSNQGGAALAAEYGALSADHLEHASVQGIKAMARAGTVAVLLPGAFYALKETRKPPVGELRAAGVPIAVSTDCNPGTSPLLSPTLAMNMACVLFGLRPEEALAGMTREGARALGVLDDVGTITASKAADLVVWHVSRPAELCYWMGHPGPERRIFAGVDA